MPHSIRGRVSIPRPRMILRAAAAAYPITRFTSFPGTTITFRIALVPI